MTTLQLFRNDVSRSVGGGHLAGLVCCLRYIDRRRYYLLSTPFSERLQVVSMEQWIGHIIIILKHQGLGFQDGPSHKQTHRMDGHYWNNPCVRLFCITVAKVYIPYLPNRFISMIQLGSVRHLTVWMNSCISHLR